MSLVKTLAKVAIGVAIAKGASSMMKNKGGASGGLGGLLGGMSGGGAGTGAPFGGAKSRGGVQGLMGALLGGSSQGGKLGQGGLGGLLNQLGGAGGSAGGLNGIIGGLAGAGAAGGLRGMLGSLAKGLDTKPRSTRDDFGAVLNSQFDATPETAIEPSADQEAAAALMLRAMIHATKADGMLDEAEKTRLIEHLGGEIDAEEAAFVEAELQSPLDLDGLIRDTPEALSAQVYAMSVLGIELDNQAEAQYLHGLAQGLGLDADTVNDIHAQLGVPALYA